MRIGFIKNAFFKQFNTSKSLTQPSWFYFIFIGVFMFHGPIVKAQYAVGYVVKNNGDTLYGKVKDRSGEVFTRMYSKIRFKSDGYFFQKRYSPKQIIAYKTGDRLYETHWIKVRTLLLKVNYFSKPGFGKREFFRVVEKGKLSLYYSEFMDEDSSIVDYVELFKREGDYYFVRATQGVFGLKKNLLSEYFQNQQEVRDKIVSGELKTAFQVVRFYNETY
jgi:hypothetical protein